MSGLSPQLPDRRVDTRVVYQRRRDLPPRANNSLRRTYDLLRSSLHHSLEPGCLLVESELVQTLSSSRNTVRAALQLLAREGLVTRGPKIGTTVRGSTVLPLTDLLTVQDKALAYRMQTEGLGTTVIPVPELVRRWLRLPPGSSVAVIEGLVYQDDEPVGLSVSYVGLTAEQEHEVGQNTSDVIGLLEERLQISLGECETTVAALACDRETADLLGIAEGAPMLWFEDFMRDTDGRPRAFCQLRYRGDRVAFSAIARRPKREELGTLAG
jgi:GntR family transcriptional regulator